ncbi:MAG: phosphate acyltransferase [Candidatus Omnitrophica bacterium]|nr:phosphate acyltransferase [Candidatus Omnitrophota bacterium]
MDIVANLRDKAKRRMRRIILPEPDDRRVVEAEKIIREEKIADVTLLSKGLMDKKLMGRFTEEFFELRQSRGITLDEAKQTVSDPLYYCAMMVRDGMADGFVAGAAYTTPSVARAAIYCLGLDRRLDTVSSSFIMVVPDCAYGDNGVFVFADCGIVPDPSPRQLANIAVSTAELAKRVLDITPRVAMLSYSTKGSAEGRFVNEVKEATALVKEIEPGLLVEGELQVDAAIIPEVSQIKYQDSAIGGRANVLIFPDLESGNIAYKLVQRLAKARAIGPLLQGLNKPASDLSRGCEVDDIVDCVAVTSLRAK